MVRGKERRVHFTILSLLQSFDISPGVALITYVSLTSARVLPAVIRWGFPRYISATSSPYNSLHLIFHYLARTLLFVIMTFARPKRSFAASDSCAIDTIRIYLSPFSFFLSFFYFLATICSKNRRFDIERNRSLPSGFLNVCCFESTLFPPLL